ncbi:CoA-binding protein [Zhihengliuella somnathii]
MIKRLLSTPARWAVVGLTSNPDRVALPVSAWIQDHLGMEIIPVNLRGEPVLGLPAARTLAEIEGRVDVVDCFVNSTKVGDVVDQAIAIGAGAVWMQLGVIDHAAAARAREAGLDVVMNTCPKIEVVRL